MRGTFRVQSIVEAAVGAMPEQVPSSSLEGGVRGAVGRGKGVGAEGNVGRGRVREVKPGVGRHAGTGA